jgi:Zn-dependent peptidase ImmA (M78 family)
VTLPRGFKANAERKAMEFREGLGLTSTAPIDVVALAAHCGAEVVSGEDLIERFRFEELESMQVGAFSAATFMVEGKSYIVTSPLTSDARRRSDIAHELGHLILEHELSEIREIEGVPFRSCRPDEEEQATAFGATVLLPRPLLISMIRKGFNTPEKIASAQNISVEMARFRLNSTGILKQLSR